MFCRGGAGRERTRQVYSRPPQEEAATKNSAVKGTIPRRKENRQLPGEDGLEKSGVQTSGKVPKRRRGGCCVLLGGKLWKDLIRANVTEKVNARRTRSGFNEKGMWTT